MKSTKEIRKELAILIKSKLSLVNTKAEKNNAVNEARQEINIKYGKDWRDRDLFKPRNKSNHHKEPSIYDDHIHGEHWMD